MSDQIILDTNFVQHLLNAGGTVRWGEGFTGALDNFVRSTNQPIVLRGLEAVPAV